VRQALPVASDLVEELREPSPLTYRRFLVEWYGKHRPDFGVPVAELIEPMPRALRSFYTYAGRWPNVFEFNNLFGPDERGADEDDKLVFCSENQGVCVWATEKEGGDPPVYVRGSIEIDPLEREWHLEGEPVSRFLLQLILFEAALAAPFGASALAQPRDMVDRLLEPLSLLSLAPWEWPAHGTRFWAGDDIIAVVSPDPGGRTEEVLIGARTPPAIDYVRGLPAEIWDSARLP